MRQLVIEAARDVGARAARTARRRVTAAVMAAAMVVSLPGVAFAETYRIRATGTDRWRPVHTYIGKGDRVVWRNPTKRMHDVKSIGKNWTYARRLPPGERVRRFFRSTGTFRFRCVRHSAMVDGRCRGMCGFIHVYKK